jgi:hypothetical protein
MATITARRPAPSRLALFTLAVLAVLIADTALSGERPAAASGRWASEVVPAVVAAYGQVGTLAVAITHQQELPAGEPIRGYDARRARAAEWSADNGDAATRPFPTASMVKLFVAEDILHRARTGELRLTQQDFALLQVMIRRSDDPAASALWVRYGGGRMVSDVAARYGLTGTAPPRSAGEWGETTTTARDLARFLSLLPVAAHPEDADAVLGWMRAATARAADGFDQRFGLFGADPDTAVKQGWMCCVGGNRHLHSVGVVGHRVVVLLSEVPRTVRYDDARAALTAAAGAVPPPETG